MRQCAIRASALGLAYTVLLAAATPALAQQSSFGSTSVGGTSSFGLSGNGSSFGSGSSLGGSSLGGGSSGSSGSFGLGSTGVGTTTGASGTGRTGTTQVGATSFEGAYYVNPFTLGLATGTSGAAGATSGNFGSPLYNLSTLTTGTASISSTQNSNMANGFGAGVNVRRLPAYATTLKFAAPPPPPPAQVRADLQNMLAQTTQLNPADSVRITMDGPAVVLRGRVADDDERRLVENMVLLSPGVNQVRNELSTGKPSP